MNFQILYKQYTPSFLGWIGFHAASICLPQLSPSLGVWYHGKQLIQNIDYTNALHKDIEVQLPYESQPTVISCIAQDNDILAVSNISGLTGSIIDLGRFIFDHDDYIKCTFRSQEKLDHISDWGSISLMLYVISFILGSISYISTTKEYDFIDMEKGIHIDPYLMTHSKTKVLSFLSELQAEDYQESNDLLISSEIIQPQDIEAITIPSA